MPPSFSVTGGRALKGTIRPAGNKNAALPILAATLLADGPCRIDNVPHIRDVETMLALLVHLGADVRWLGPNSVEVNTARAEPRELDPALCARIRASILLAGPMLARFGRVSLPPPGGDVIGRRRPGGTGPRRDRLVHRARRRHQRRDHDRRRAQRGSPQYPVGVRAAGRATAPRWHPADRGCRPGAPHPSRLGRARPEAGGRPVARLSRRPTVDRGRGRAAVRRDPADLPEAG